MLLLPVALSQTSLPAWDDGGALVRGPEVVWSTALTGRVLDGSVVALQGDALGVLTTHTDGVRLTVIGPDGVVRWTHDRPDHPSRAALIAADGAWVQADDLGRVLSVLDGSERWSTPAAGEGTPFGRPMLWDGSLVLFGADTRLVDPATGDVRKRHPFRAEGGVVLPLDDDDRPDLLLGHQTMVAIAASSGGVLWRQKADGDGLPAVLPMDGRHLLVRDDGWVDTIDPRTGSRTDARYVGPAPGSGGRLSGVAAHGGCLVATIDGGTDRVVRCHGPDGVRWERGFQHASVRVPPVLGSADGSAESELLVATEPGELVALDVDGRTAWRWRAPGRIHHQPVVTDLTGDGVAEILVVTEEGRVTALRVDRRPPKRKDRDPPRAAPLGTVLPRLDPVRGASEEVRATGSCTPRSPEACDLNGPVWTGASQVDDGVRPVAPRPGGGLLVADDRSGRLGVWSPAGLAWGPFVGSVTGALVAPDGVHLEVTARDGVHRVRVGPAGMEPWDGDPAEPTDPARSPSGRWRLRSVAPLAVEDASTGALLHELDLACDRAVWSADDDLLCQVGDAALGLWGGQPHVEPAPVRWIAEPGAWIAALTGRVLVGGAPVPHASVWAGHAGRHATRTDADGRFALQVPAGPVRVGASHPSLAGRRGDVVTVGASDRPLDLQLGVPAWAEGRVRVPALAAGTPAPALSVTVEGCGHVGPVVVEGVRFVLTGLTPGAVCLVTARWDDTGLQGSATFEAGAVTAVEVALTVPAGWARTMWMDHTGRPVSNARIGDRITDAEGRVLAPSGGCDGPGWVVAERPHGAGRTCTFRAFPVTLVAVDGAVDATLIGPRTVRVSLEANASRTIWLEPTRWWVGGTSLRPVDIHGPDAIGVSAGRDGVRPSGPRDGLPFAPSAEGLVVTEEVREHQVDLAVGDLLLTACGEPAPPDFDPFHDRMARAGWTCDGTVWRGLDVVPVRITRLPAGPAAPAALGGP